MNLMQLIKDAGGEASLSAAGEIADISDRDLSEIVHSASPLLIRKLQERLQTTEGRNWLRRQAESGGPQQFVDRPSLISASAVEIDGNRLLDKLVGGHNVAEQVALHIAHSAELKVDKVAAVLPAIAALFVGAVCKGIGS